MLAWPPLEPIKVDRICTVVVLPDPFGPSRANVVPAGTSKSIPSSTTLSPNDLRSPETAMALGMPLPPVSAAPSAATRGKPAPARIHGGFTTASVAICNQCRYRRDLPQLLTFDHLDRVKTDGEGVAAPSAWGRVRRQFHTSGRRQRCQETEQ